MKNIEQNDLLLNNFKIVQDKERFCLSIDAVLISNFAEIKEMDSVLDIGCGSGGISLILCAKHKNINVTAIDIIKSNCDLVKESKEINQIDNLEIINSDFNEIDFQNRKFRKIISNPPYFEEKRGRVPKNYEKAVAKHEIKLSLEQLLIKVSKILDYKGTFYMIHIPERLQEIMQIARNNKLYCESLRSVYSFKNSNDSAKFVMLSFGKKNKDMVVKQPLYIYNKEKEYTEEVLEYYKF